MAQDTTPDIDPQTERLMTEIGPAMRFALVVLEPDGQSWSLMRDADTGVLVEPRGEDWVLRAMAPIPDNADHAELSAHVLSGNRIPDKGPALWSGVIEEMIVVKTTCAPRGMTTSDCAGIRTRLFERLTEIAATLPRLKSVPDSDPGQFIVRG